MLDMFGVLVGTATQLADDGGKESVWVPFLKIRKTNEVTYCRVLSYSTSDDMYKTEMQSF